MSVAVRRVALLPDAAAPLRAAVAESAFAAIVDGDCADADIAAFLVALADRGETVAEVAAAARPRRWWCTAATGWTS